MGSTNVSPKLRALQPLQVAILLRCVFNCLRQKGVWGNPQLKDTQGNGWRLERAKRAEVVTEAILPTVGVNPKTGSSFAKGYGGQEGKTRQ